jgi:hypothetical protein
MGRAQGSNAAVRLKRENSYGVQATGNYYVTPFTSDALGKEQGLIDDPVLGFGRDPQAPLLDVARVTGDIGVPVDMRSLGFILTGLFGDPDSTQVAARGSITFGSNPSEGDTVTINGTAYTFISGASSGTDVQIKGTLSLTLDELVSVLNASADTDVDDATYSKTGTTQLTIVHDTAGTAGNGFTLAASAATVSAATLRGGGYEHVFTSGGSDLPSYSMEKANPEVPAFFVRTGVMFNSIALNFQRSGAATATVAAIAQAEARFDTTQAGTPVELDFNRVSQFKGAVRIDGALVANLTNASLTYSNNLDVIDTIRDDEKIEGADPSQASMTGTLEMRFADTTFIDQAGDNTPLEDVEFTYDLSASQKLTFTVHELWLSKPKQPITGPGGVQSSFEFRGAKSATAGQMLTVTLLNDLDGTQYA